MYPIKAVWDVPVDCSLCLAENIEQCRECAETNRKEVLILALGCGTTGERAVIRSGNSLLSVYISELTVI